jgi:DNA-directed RNA polymerase beta subunit
MTNSEEIDYMDVSPKQVVSCAASSNSILRK